MGLHPASPRAKALLCITLAPYKTFSIFGHGAAWSFLAGDKTRPSTRMSIPAGGSSIKITAFEKG
uniref:Uncharacterized protein n=1 Tax=Arundo donax TaxID=35708 RepID=A0A0A9BW64_ARUDO